MKNASVVGRSISRLLTIKKPTFLVLNIGLLLGFSLQVFPIQSDTIPLKETDRAVTITSSEFSKIKDYSLMNTLIGKVPGLTIHTSSVGVGGAPYVQVRGMTSFRGENAPLYMVDGMPISSFMPQNGNGFGDAWQTGDGFSFFNMDDIESVSVVKGFTPSIVYPNAGANGIIMITTKRGHDEKLSINYSHSTLYNSPFKMPEFQRTYGFKGDEHYPWGDKLSAPSTYDPKDFFQTSYCAMNTLSLSFGNKYSQTYASVGMENGQNLIPNSQVDRYNGTLRNTFNIIDDRLKIDLGGMLMRVKEQNLQNGSSLLALLYLYPITEKIDQAQYNSRYIKDYEEYDAEKGYKKEFCPYNVSNPYWLVNRLLYPTDKQRYMLSAALSFKVTNWLELLANSRYENNAVLKEEKIYAGQAEFVPEKGVYSYFDESLNLSSHQLMLNVNKRIKDFSISGAFNFSFLKENYASKYKNIYPVLPNVFEDINSFNQAAYSSYYKIGDIQKSLSSMFEIGYKDKCFVNLKNNWYKSIDYLNFKSKTSLQSFSPNIGTSFVLSEIFPIKSSVLSYLNLSGSYSDIYYLVPFFRKYRAAFSYGLQAPERTKLYELGIDGRLFGDKLDFSLSWYKSTSGNNFDIVIPVSGPNENYKIPINGDIQTKGVELTVGFKQIFEDKLWISRLNFSSNRMTVLNMEKEVSQATLESDYLFRKTARLGEALGDLDGCDFDRDENGNIIVDTQKMMPQTRNRNFVKLGNIQPKFRLSWQNDLTWKRFTLAMMLNGRFGGECASSVQKAMDESGMSKATGDARDNGGVMVSGVKIPVDNYYSSSPYVASPYIYSATNIRLAELSLGYDVPIEKWVKFVKGVHVSLVGRNLLMLYCKAPFDPELSLSPNGTYEGIDYFMLPSLRSIGFSLNVRI